MTQPAACRRPPLRVAAGLALASFVLAAACGGGPSGAPAGPPPMPVEVVTLRERPVEQATEFVATVKSRRSTAVQPQVEGFVTRIMVRSGDRVRPGQPLMQIDSGMQEAAVKNLESIRAAREADLQFARQESARLKTLLEAGAASRSEAEQAETALQTAEAQLEAILAQIRQQQVALAYHRVSAPTAGVVGDVPVRVGDSVTRSTVLTTIDQNAGLELYINVPVQEASRLKPGIPVHILDAEGEVATTVRVSFVSPSVDPGTQSVLAKADLEQPGGFRTEQIVRCRIVWAEAPAMTVPVVAVNRIGGQFFAYVAEAADGGGTVARQRVVEMGPVVGNEYVVRSGLEPGEKLIVSGVQKIGDGAPVTIAPPAGPGSPAAPEGGKVG